MRAAVVFIPWTVGTPAAVFRRMRVCNRSTGACDRARPAASVGCRYTGHGSTSIAVWGAASAGGARSPWRVSCKPRPGGRPLGSSSARLKAQTCHVTPSHHAADSWRRARNHHGLLIVRITDEGAMPCRVVPRTKCGDIVCQDEQGARGFRLRQRRLRLTTWATLAPSAGVGIAIGVAWSPRVPASIGTGAVALGRPVPPTSAGAAWAGEAMAHTNVSPQNRTN